MKENVGYCQFCRKQKDLEVIAIQDPMSGILIGTCKPCMKDVFTITVDSHNRRNT